MVQVGLVALFMPLLWRHLYLQTAEVKGKRSPRRHGSVGCWGSWQLGAWTRCLWHPCGRPHGGPPNRGHPCGHPHLLCHPHGFPHGCPCSVAIPTPVPISAAFPMTTPVVIPTAVPIPVAILVAVPIPVALPVAVLMAVSISVVITINILMAVPVAVCISMAVPVAVPTPTAVPMTILVPAAVPVSTSIPMAVPWRGTRGSAPMGAWLWAHMVCETPCFVRAVALGGSQPQPPVSCPPVPAATHAPGRSKGVGQESLPQCTLPKQKVVVKATQKTIRN